MDSRVKRASGKTGRFFLEIAAAVVVGAGIPLLWVWIGSLIQSSRGAQHVEAGTALIIIVGIVTSYLIVLFIASWIQARGQDDEDSQGQDVPPPTHEPAP